jgi:mono/diheme cytochrome c family protein
MKKLMIGCFSLLFSACSVDHEATSFDDQITSESTPAFIAVQTIFTANCAPCHITGTSGGLSLQSAYNNIVGVPSTAKPALFLINQAEADPDSSYLLMKIRGDEGISGARMAYLSAEEVTALVNWVKAGAPN